MGRAVSLRPVRWTSGRHGRRGLAPVNAISIPLVQTLAASGCGIIDQPGLGPRLTGADPQRWLVERGVQDAAVLDFLLEGLGAAADRRTPKLGRSGVNVLALAGNAGLLTVVCTPDVVQAAQLVAAMAPHHDTQTRWG